MLIEQQKRRSRVRFQHPIRVVTLDGQPRVIRTLTANVSRDGLFLRMPEPLPAGMKVALSLEAGGRALALAQAEVVWTGADENELTERFSGCGVRFTEFMHPRAEELVQYLVRNLDQGKPLMLAPPERRWMRWLPIAGMGALVACAALGVFVLWTPSAPTLEMIAGTPTVRAIPTERVDQKGPLPPAVLPEQSRGDRAFTRVNGALEPWVPIPLDSARGERNYVVPRYFGEPSQADLRPAPDERVAAPVQADARVAAPTMAAEREAAPVQLVARVAASARERQEKGTVKLPSGAAPSLRWTLSGNELRLSPELAGGSQVTRAFVLSGPARAVFDISGEAPLRSLVVPASLPHSTGVRLGKQGAGTRIVVDLGSAPKRSTQDGISLVLSF